MFLDYTTMIGWSLLTSKEAPCNMLAIETWSGLLPIDYKLMTWASPTCKRVPAGLDEVRCSAGKTCLRSTKHRHAKLCLRQALKIYHYRHCNSIHRSKSLPSFAGSGNGDTCNTTSTSPRIRVVNLVGCQGQGASSTAKRPRDRDLMNT